MSRIRSIHPGLWTDEAFVSLSPMARLLLMGIWNECDDMGSFAWSPLTLKMRVLPADNVDAGELLAEMASAGVVKRYEVGGKAYGAVRNFCQYQRPKKPNSTYPQTPEIAAWVNINARSSRDGGEEVPNQLPTEPEIARQMEDGGGVKEGCSDEQPRARKRAAPVEIPPEIPGEPYAAFRKMRRAMRVPFTDDAERGIIADLLKLRAEGHDLEKVLMKAVKRGWRGVFGDDDTKAKTESLKLSPAEQIANLKKSIEFYSRINRPDDVEECRRKLAKLEGGTGPPKIASIVKQTADTMTQQTNRIRERM